MRNIFVYEVRIVKLHIGAKHIHLNSTHNPDRAGGGHLLMFNYSKNQYVYIYIYNIYTYKTAYFGNKPW